MLEVYSMSAGEHQRELDMVILDGIHSVAGQQGSKTDTSSPYLQISWCIHGESWTEIKIQFC